MLSESLDERIQELEEELLSYSLHLTDDLEAKHGLITSEGVDKFIYAFNKDARFKDMSDRLMILKFSRERLL
jgi:hypothetical protein